MKTQKGGNISAEVKKPHKNEFRPQEAQKDSSNGKHASLLSSSERKEAPRRVLKTSGCLLRMLLLDLPVILLFILLVSTYVFQYVMHEYLEPQLHLLRKARPREFTYYRRPCTERDISTRNTLDLVAKDTQDAVEKTLIHGASVHPNLLSNDTARELRGYILEQNKIRKTLHLAHEPENRSSYGFTPNEDPVLAKALNEVLSNERFRHAIEAIAGKDPAIVECSHITSNYGAVDQDFHSDIGADVSPTAYARNGVPSYSLFIPLQDTTKEMGATGICPGTHLCRAGASLSCRENGFQVFGESEAWPTGWGFLYNSAMIHRGTAHTDPDEPARVLLLLTFLSRPRSEKNTLETRYISDHYFNRWMAWGHTLSDFAQPAKYMAQPWQTLRTLGIYKAPGRKWGWDYPTVLLLYIASFENEEESVEGSLGKCIEQAGLSRLPSFLQVDVPKFDGDMAKNWVDYFDRLLTKWQWVFFPVYALCLSVNILMTVLLVGKSSTRQSFARLTLFHGIILGAIWLLLRRASTSTWAENIKSGRLYQTPTKSIGPKLPSTLPLLSDILTPDDYQSEYLASYNQILDYGHAGNRQWNEMLKVNSIGYASMESRLQEQLSAHILLWARQQQSRILTKNHLNQWAELDEGRAKRFAHKELMKASNPFVNHVVRWTDFLLSETKYGYWRETSMHSGAIPSLLRDLQSKLLRFPCSSKANLSIIPASEAVDLVVGRSLSVKSSLPFLSNKRDRSISSVSKISRVPPEPPIVEPYPGAWLNTGDMMEGMYSKSEAEQSPGDWVKEGDTLEGIYAETTNDWLPGRITAANYKSMKWDVFYLNDKSDDRLCHRCVRRFAPFTVGETIKYLSKGSPMSSAVDARITGIHNGLYDIEMVDDKEVLRKVPITRLHRSRTDKYMYRKGKHALVNLGPDDAMTVKILRVNGNGTLTVGTSDGLTGNVNASQLQPHMTWYEQYINYY